MLRWRLILGPILIALLIGIFTLDARTGPEAPYLLGLCLLLGIRSSWELVQLLQTRSFQPNLVLVTACSAAIIAANWFHQTPFGAAHNGPGVGSLGTGALGPAMLMLSLSIVALLISGGLRYRAPGTSMETLGAELLVLCYVGVLTSVTAQLRWVAGDDTGYLALGSLVVVTKCGDTVAYTFGRLFGRKKMAPLLSPGKTWMGAFGALVGGAAGAWAWFHWATPLLSAQRVPSAAHWAVLYGLVIAVTGMVGDLCESLIKRDLGKKDSAPLLPGFGGLLDLLDSVIFAGPVAYVLWLVLPLLSK